MSQIKVQNKDLDALQDKDESVDEGDSQILASKSHNIQKLRPIDKFGYYQNVKHKKFDINS